MNYLEFKKSRLRIGLTQEKIGNMFGVAKVFITEYENTGTIPTLQLQTINSFLESKLHEEPKLKGFSRLTQNPIEPELFYEKTENNRRVQKIDFNQEKASFSNINLKDLRMKMKLTQVGFADLIGVDRRTIINYEQGTKIPKARVSQLQLLYEKEKLKGLDYLKNIKSMPNVPELLDVIKPILTTEQKYVALLEEEIDRLKTRLLQYE
jgi:transcriptional regulator with XRE-family HTH domain